jgi:NAD(P)-dependent dehydrogenase (short-subunit alcohol dehydrogenase family)
MEDLAGKVAFITGGASGLGLAMARIFGRAGMITVIADLRQDRMDESLKLLRSDGINASGVTLDVTDRAAYKVAADEVEATIGPVQLLCNNAGIGIMGRLAEATYKDWDWILGVNLGGVVNGLCTFLPRMRARGKECHVLATASAAGLVASENVGIYVGAKMAVVGIMEVLRAEVASDGIGVSVVCPHLMRTHIYEHASLRPPGFGNADVGQPASASAISQEMLEAMSAAGMDPLEVAEHTLEAVLENRLYVIPFPELRGIIHQRYEALVASIPNTIPDARRVSMEAPTLSFLPYLEAVRRSSTRR